MKRCFRHPERKRPSGSDRGIPRRNLKGTATEFFESASLRSE